MPLLREAAALVEAEDGQVLRPQLRPVDVEKGADDGKEAEESALSKYRAIRTEVDGIPFASKREAQRYMELAVAQRAGIIHELTLQQKFPLVVNGVKVCTYIADFCYRDQQGRAIVEDSKVFKTPVYKLKYKLFHILYPNLRISEV